MTWAVFILLHISGCIWRWVVVIEFRFETCWDGKGGKFKRLKLYCQHHWGEQFFFGDSSTVTVVFYKFWFDWKPNIFGQSLIRNWQFFVILIYSGTILLLLGYLFWIFFILIFQVKYTDPKEFLAAELERAKSRSPLEDEADRILNECDKVLEELERTTVEVRDKSDQVWRQYDTATIGIFEIMFKMNKIGPYFGLKAAKLREMYFQNFHIQFCQLFRRFRPRLMGEESAKVRLR